MRTVIALLLIPIAIGVRQFRLGRSKHGSLAAPAGAQNLSLPQAQWFDQKLDHNNPSDVRMWKQRYFVNNSFFIEKGPIFLMIGGEGPADPRWMVKGAWIEYAKKFKALCFQLEHRFYGESQPLANLTVKNLRHLSSTQALEDIAYFIAAMNKEYKFNGFVKWIVFGGSYPGSLAAWSRFKYPHLIFAAISSSGPLQAKVNFQEYFQVVVAALREKTGDDLCVNEIKTAHRQIEELLVTKPEEIEEEFVVCQPFSLASKYDLYNFYNSLADDFADLVQYNEDNRISSDTRFKNLTINTVCNILTEPGSTPAYKKLAKFNSIMLKKAKSPCLDYSYNSMIEDLRDTTNFSQSSRQWMWQTCTEFGYYQTSSAEFEIFGDFLLDFFVQQCIDVFGFKFNKAYIMQAADWTNSNYGGLDIAVSRVVFVHGSVDPWHALGITKTKDKNAPAIFIKGTAHCADMYPSSPEDAPALVEARVQIQQYLTSWMDLP